MKTKIFKALPNNQIQTLSDDIRLQLLGQKGIYDVVRFVKKDAALYLTAHLERFVQSAALEKIELPYTISEIREYLYECLRNIDYFEFRAKIFYCLDDLDGLFYVFEDLTDVMQEMKTKRSMGVHLGSYQVKRLIPESKSIEWLKMRVDIKDQFLSGFDEGLIVNSGGQILEGLSSNFFYIIDNVVYSADTYILNGVTRQILLNQMDVQTGFLNLDDVGKIDEAFITSTSRGVIPVKSINSIKINQASFGQKTLEISNSYSGWVLNYLEILDY